MFKRLCTLSIVALGFLQVQAQGVSIGTLDKVIDEASGMTIASTPGVFAYVLNDSGDTSRFFGIDDKGRLINTFYFKGVEGDKGVRDCEDMASGKGAEGNQRYIYIGDIGDNGASRPFITIYRTPEPVQSMDAVRNVNAEPVFFKYPDGPRDAEAMMIDNIDRLLYIISKREDTIGIYTASLLWNTGDTVVLQKKAALYFPGMRPGKWITAGDISWDGKKIIVKSLQKVFFWQRKKNEPVWQTLLRPVTELPYLPEPQGESICFNTKGNAYYTVSEGENQPVYYYKISKKDLKRSKQ